MLKELTALAATEAIVAGRRKAARAMLYATSALLALAAAGFALAGLHSILALDYGPIAASFLIAGGLLIMALLIAIATKLWRPRPTATEQLATVAIAAAPAAARAALPSAAKGVALVGSLALGAILGRRAAADH